MKAPVFFVWESTPCAEQESPKTKQRLDGDSWSGVVFCVS